MYFHHSCLKIVSNWQSLSHPFCFRWNRCAWTSHVVISATYHVFSTTSTSTSTTPTCSSSRASCKQARTRRHCAGSWSADSSYVCGAGRSLQVQTTMWKVKPWLEKSECIIPDGCMFWNKTMKKKKKKNGWRRGNMGMGDKEWKAEGSCWLMASRYLESKRS